jgi:hypothetical protein
MVKGLNSQKLLQTLKVARGCSKGKKLLKTPKVAHKLPSTIYKGLMESASAQWVNQTFRHTLLFYCVLNATRVYSFRVESVGLSGLGPVYMEVGLP